MWFWRGTQSAIFFYVACTPCNEWRYKRKRRREAERTLKERAAVETNQPGVIQQPVSFTTNTYWAEEIIAGPGPPSGWRGHKVDGHDHRQTPQRRKKNKSVFSPTREPICDNNGSGSIPLEDTSPSPDNDSPQALEQSTLSGIKEGIKAAVSSDKWNWVRHDRPDEILWDYEAISRRIKAVRSKSIGGQQGSSGTKSPTTPTTPSHRTRAETVDSERSRDYYNASRHPEINELSPPVVSMLPRTKGECAWMLQPPPPAAVMAGRIHPSQAPLPLRSPTPPAPSPIDDSQPAVMAASKPPASTFHAARPSLATILSLDSNGHSPAQRARTLQFPPTPSPTSSPTSPQFPHHRKASRTQSPFRFSTDTATEPEPIGGSDDTEPEWDFLVQMYQDGRHNFIRGGAGAQKERERWMRASWHGHERRYSEI